MVFCCSLFRRPIKKSFKLWYEGHLECDVCLFFLNRVFIFSTNGKLCLNVVPDCSMHFWYLGINFCMSLRWIRQSSYIEQSLMMVQNGIQVANQIPRFFLVTGVPGFNNVITSEERKKQPWTNWKYIYLHINNLKWNWVGGGNLVWS